uniref:DDE-1 domain-containing protein n=1 Tax=Cacopsylla melanoneura TaxID=428564 RepID=A0A8D8ZBR9_9HEMI
MALRTPRKLTSTRAKTTKEKILTRRNEIETYLSENDLLQILSDPSRIFNSDEAEFFLNPKGNKVLVSRGARCVYQLVNPNENKCITFLMTGNAHGQIAPTLVLFSYDRISQPIVANLPSENWSVGKSENGWMTSETFFEYITNVFHPWIIREKIESPVLFFCGWP